MKIAFHATLILQVDSNKSRDAIGTTIRQLRAPSLKQFNVVVPFARLYNKCNKIRQQTDGVMGGTPLRDRRGGRLP